MIDDRSYYPSCVVNLTIRYDEALQIATAPGKTRRTQRDRRAAPSPTVTFGDITVETAAGVRKIKSPFARPRPGLNERTAAPLIITPKRDRRGKILAGSTSGQVLEPLTFGSDSFTVIGSRVPLKGAFSLPHPREAARFNLTFDYADLPIDPRLVRALGVEIHLGTVSAANYARGMAGKRDRDGRPLSILRTRTDLLDPFTGKPAVDDGTLLFFGVADQWDVDHDCEGGSMVFMEGRDIRGLLIDAKIPPAQVAKIDLAQPIDVVVANIIKTMGIDHDLQFDVMTDESEWPNHEVPSPGDANGLTRVRLGSSGSKPTATAANGGGGGGNKTSYWDLITNYCTLVGAMPQWRGTTLWIRPTRSVFDLVLDTKLETPFKGGRARTVGSEQIRVRRLVYGRDLKKLTFSRKFMGKVVPIIRCVSFDDQGEGEQRLIFGQWPPDNSPEAQAKADSEVLTVPMYGIRSVERLIQIARGVYEEIGRGETGGTADSSVLASYGGDNSDPDLLRLRPTEPVEFVVDARTLKARSPLVSELNNIERRTFDEEVEVLYQRLGDRDLARALTALARNAVREVLQFYQVIGVQYDWHGAKGGVRTQFTFQNYIVPRHADMAAASKRANAAKPRSTRAEVVGQQRQAAIKDAQRIRDTTKTNTADESAIRDAMSGRRPRPRTPTVTFGTATGIGRR